MASKKIIPALLIATVLAASASGSAFADDHRGRGNDGLAIAAGILGVVAIGSIIANSTAPGYAPPAQVYQQAPQPYYAPQQVYYQPAPAPVYVAAPVYVESRYRDHPQYREYREHREYRRDYRDGYYDH